MANPRKIITSNSTILATGITFESARRPDRLTWSPARQAARPAADLVAVSGMTMPHRIQENLDRPHG
jgi:hypothetical protein